MQLETAAAFAYRIGFVPGCQIGRVYTWQQNSFTHGGFDDEDMDKYGGINKK